MAKIDEILKAEPMNITEKLSAIQTELKAPKNLYNSFGKYKYRNAEGIMEAVKPLLKQYGCYLIVKDDIVFIGDRYYIKATATIGDVDESGIISTSALAREEDTKKGMDGSQITGTASSYARKYALNGLFILDDTKDADTDELHEEQEAKAKKDSSPKKEPTPKEMAQAAYPSREEMMDVALAHFGEKKILDGYGVKSVDEIDDAKWMAMYNKATQ